MTKDEKRFEAAKAAMQAMLAGNGPITQDSPAWIQFSESAVEHADALLAALGESAPDVPELPAVGLGHRITDSDGDTICVYSVGEKASVSVVGKFEAVHLTPPQLLELAALCIAHYREMTK